MQVVKVLNTSVVLAVDKGGGEVILMGKGIGRDIIRLAAETDAEIFGVAKEIIDYAKNTYHLQLMEHIYLALTDHLSFAVDRVRNGTAFPGFYSLEVKRFYPNEFAIGHYAATLVEQQLGVRLPESELGNIAFHFINAQKEHGYSGETRKMVGIIRDILEIVKYTFGVSYNEETIAYSRFMTHIQALAQRVLKNQQLCGDIQDLLGSSVKEKCRRELLCSEKIADYIRQQYEILLAEQEKLYLAIHIHRVLEENAHTNTKP